ncbi:hypothetical protein CHU95_17505 [Niveispirillum lacus]|uniref:Uncharacterized protein n=1 Tax=Niveispirillum lacus TaxID=1981099 RepID=A0A255YTL9_9PROT|nr:hypothetical protein [Niveispirillum lacus]OYQ32577.1 hypothetical protein CHU95_17505 [Niveispirillum lacus]
MTTDLGLTRLGEWDRPSGMPEGLAGLVASWPVINRSPGGEAFLDGSGLIRVSDVWNLPSGAFVTDRPVDIHAGWAVARLVDTVWKLIEVAPAHPRDAGRALLRDRAERLLLGRRWTGADLEALDSLLKSAPVSQAEFLGADAGRERALKSLIKLRLVLVTDGIHPALPAPVANLLAGGPVLWLNADAQEVAAQVMAHSRRRMEVSAKRVARDDKQRGADLKDSIAQAVKAVFPGMPDDVSLSVAARLAPASIKLGRRPGTQSIVDCTAEIRLDRWRQVIIGDPRVSARLAAMQAKGDNNRARKRYRDQRALEQVAEEIARWRGDLEPVASRWLGDAV